MTAWVLSKFVWGSWALLMLLASFFTLFMLAFGEDVAHQRQAASRLATVSAVGWATAAGLSFWLISTRSSWTGVILGLGATLIAPAVTIGAIAISFRNR